MDREAVFRELEYRVDRPGDEFLRVGLARARLLTADPVFQIAGSDVLGDGLTARAPGIVADGVVGAGLPEFRSESRGQGARRGSAHIRVHPGELLDREQVGIGERDVAVLARVGLLGESHVGRAVVFRDPLESVARDVEFVDVDGLGFEVCALLEFAGLEFRDPFLVGPGLVQRRVDGTVTALAGFAVVLAGLESVFERPDPIRQPVAVALEIVDPPGFRLEFGLEGFDALREGGHAVVTHRAHLRSRPARPRLGCVLGVLEGSVSSRL